MCRRKALLIGVPEYRRTEIPQLSFIRDDIIKLQEALESSDYHVKTIGINEHYASLGEIQGEIEDFCIKADKNDTLILCFSGHGLHFKGKDYLIPYDAKISDLNPEKFLIPVDFNQLFENSPAETILFFIDACREGVEFGTQGISSVKQWGTEKLKLSKKRDTAYIFACDAGEVSRYISGENGFSLFSRALAETIDANYPAKTFGDLKKELQNKMNELADENKKPKQKIRVLTESSSKSIRIDLKEICNAPTDREDQMQHENSWYKKAVSNSLWDMDEIKSYPFTEELKSVVGELVCTCHEQWLAAETALNNKAWFDEQYPIRIIERIAFLISRCQDSIKLSAPEAALLVVTPFVREAVLANGVIQAERAKPYLLDVTGTTMGIRGMLEKTYQTLPQFVRKAKRLKENGFANDHDLIAIWLIYRCILKMPEIWIENEKEGCIPDCIVECLSKPAESKLDVIRESLTKDRLLEFARCIQSNPERIERIDRPGPLRKEIYVAAGTSREQVIRERMLAHLLTLAGLMAIDVRTLSEVIVDHIGLSDPITLDEVNRTISSAVWIPEGFGRSLKVACRHPAIDLALREHVQQASAVLEEIHQMIQTKKDGIDVLSGLPQRLTAHNVVPETLIGGDPAYETPHLRFQLSHNEVRELLMGEQLYGDPTLAIRELYQNALDACRYRLARISFLKQIGKYQCPEWEGHVTFRQGKDNGRPFIECEDNGIGMGHSELINAFSCAGRSFTDMPEFIEEQTEWLRCDPPIRLYPNSQFGIGVFSYFMLADEMQIETCRLDRNGNPGQRLIIQISGSTSLFRIRPLSKNGEAGTRIRLYLNKTEYAKKFGGNEKISCTSTLQKLLGVAQFRTNVIEEGNEESWIPGEIKVPSKSYYLPISILKPDQADIWWVNRGGRLLADGIDSGYGLPCAIINLHQEHRPKLTVDRGDIVEWDEVYVSNLLKDSVNVLIDNHSWLTLDWLWDLEILNANAAINVESGLLKKYDKISLPLNDLSIPLRDFGIFSHDKKIYELAKEWLRKKEINENDEEMWSAIIEIRDTVPPSLLAYRVQLFSKYGLNLPYFIKINLIMTSVPDNMPAIRAGDSIAISENSDGEAPYIEGIVSGVQVLRSAKRLGESINDTLERFHRLAPLGLIIPEFDINRLSKVSLRKEDLFILSKEFNGKAPWIRDDISFIHILMSAEILGESVEDTLQRFSLLAPIGLIIPDFDIDQLSRDSLNEEDLIILSENLDGKAPWIDGKPSVKHIA